MAIRRASSQETTSGHYQPSPLCCLSSGISHSLQMRGRQRGGGGGGGGGGCGCAGTGHEHTQAGRQAGNDPSPSQPSEPRQDRRQE